MLPIPFLTAIVASAASMTSEEEARRRTQELKGRLGIAELPRRLRLPGLPGWMPRRLAWVEQTYGPQVRDWTERVIKDAGYYAIGYDAVGPLVPWLAWNRAKGYLSDSLLQLTELEVTEARESVGLESWEISAAKARNEPESEALATKQDQAVKAAAHNKRQRLLIEPLHQILHWFLETRQHPSMEGLRLFELPFGQAMIAEEKWFAEHLPTYVEQSVIVPPGRLVARLSPLEETDDGTWGYWTLQALEDFDTFGPEQQMNKQIPPRHTPLWRYNDAVYSLRDPSGRPIVTWLRTRGGLQMLGLLSDGTAPIEGSAVENWIEQGDDELMKRVLEASRIIEPHNMSRWDGEMLVNFVSQSSDHQIQKALDEGVTEIFERPAGEILYRIYDSELMELWAKWLLAHPGADYAPSDIVEKSGSFLSDELRSKLETHGIRGLDVSSHSGWASPFEVQFYRVFAPVSDQMVFPGMKANPPLLFVKFRGIVQLVREYDGTGYWTVSTKAASRYAPQGKAGIALGNVEQTDDFVTAQELLGNDPGFFRPLVKEGQWGPELDEKWLKKIARSEEGWEEGDTSTSLDEALEWLISFMDDDLLQNATWDLPSDGWRQHFKLLDPLDPDPDEFRFKDLTIR